MQIRYSGRENTAEILTAGATVAAAAQTATLPAAAERRTYIAGFALTGAGATGASVIDVVTTGLAADLKFKVVVPAGATTSITPLIVWFPEPIPASADNTAITVQVPSFGAGNAHAALSVVGYRQ